MSTQQHFPIGQPVNVRGAFTDPNNNNVPLDPTVVHFKFKRPDTGAVTTYVYGTDSQLVKDSTGNYHVALPSDAAGEWPFRWESTGTGQAAVEASFFVDATRVA